MAESLTIFYTQDIRGDFGLAARLAGWLRHLRQQFAKESRSLLLDLGGASDISSWHHELTGGRAALFILDAMGYHAVNAAGTLSPPIGAELRAKFRLALLEEGCDWSDERGEYDVRCTLAANPRSSKLAGSLCVSLAPANRTQLLGSFLQLGALKTGSVGRAQLWLSENGIDLLESGCHPLPAEIMPEPSVLATIDFVLQEARQLASRSA